MVSQRLEKVAGDSRCHAGCAAVEFTKPNFGTRVASRRSIVPWTGRFGLAKFRLASGGKFLLFAAIGIKSSVRGMCGMEFLSGTCPSLLFGSLVGVQLATCSAPFHLGVAIRRGLVTGNGILVQFVATTKTSIIVCYYCRK